MTNTGELAFLLGSCLCFGSPLVVLTAIAAWIQVLHRRPNRGLIIATALFVPLVAVLIVFASVSFEDYEILPIIWPGWSVMLITNFINQLNPTKMKSQRKISITHWNYLAYFIIVALLIRYYFYPIPYGLANFTLESMITMASGMTLSIAWVIVNLIVPGNPESQIHISQKYSVYAVIIAAIGISIIVGSYLFDNRVEFVCSSISFVPFALIGMVFYGQRKQR